MRQKKYALNLNPSLNLHTYSRFINRASDLNFLHNHSIDFLVCAADLPRDRIEAAVDAFCYKRHIPFSFASVGIASGSWGPTIIPGKTGCYKCFSNAEKRRMSLTERRIRDRMNGITPASFGPTNMIISSFLASDVIFCLGGCFDIQSINCRVAYNFKSLQHSKFDYHRKACTCNA